MKRIRAIIVFLLAVSLPLPVFASASSMPHCDMMEDAADKPTQTTAAANASVNPDCCDCAETVACNAPCAAGLAFLAATGAVNAACDDGHGGFAPILISIYPAPPDPLLRPPISL